MTEAVINGAELQPDQKTEAMPMLEALAWEAVLPKEQRRVAVIRRLLSRFAKIMNVGAAGSTLWARLGPTIMAAFE